MAANKLANTQPVLDPDDSLWSYCNGCDRERRVIGGVMADRNMYNGREMVYCESSGRALEQTSAPELLFTSDR